MSPDLEPSTAFTPDQAQALASLRLCMLCPAQCRRTWSREEADQSEAITPSSLSLLAVLVVQGAIALDESVRGALQRRDMARGCRAACPHDLDVPASIDRLLATQVQGTAP